MTLRSFVDSTGVEWYAFDVVPRTQERRHYDRRSGAIQDDRRSGVIQAVDESDAPDRRDGDRRVTVGGQGRFSASEGWLCFEQADGHSPERRRLSPIPRDWRQCSDAELQAYCQSARLVRTREAEPHPVQRRD